MNPFDRTTVVAFELSNFCSLAWLHVKCPLRREMLSPFALREPVTLDARVVYKCLMELGHYDFAGEINFHQYNEPLMDPRLFEFIRFAHKVVPLAKVVILTNGMYLSRQLARELREAGTSSLAVTLYGSESEKERMAEFLTREIAPELPIVLGRHGLDDRATIYDRAEYSLKRPCGEPLGFVQVTCHGQVGLCCFDWKRTETFGDLHHISLAEALCSQKAQETYQRLMAGDRFMEVCKRCDTARAT